MEEHGTLVIYFHVAIPGVYEDDQPTRWNRRTLVKYRGVTLSRARDLRERFNRENWSEFTAQAVKSEWHPDPVTV